jgi:translation elongation factor EF-Tu-like GTPase
MTRLLSQALMLTLITMATISEASAATVGLLGADTMKTLAAKLDASAPGKARFAHGIDAVRRAKPSVVLLVVNAPEGPMPVHDEAIKFMSQTGVKQFAIVFTGAKEIHDPEIFELIIGEVVDKVNAAGLRGSTAPVFLDSDTVRLPANVKARQGSKALNEYLQGF